MKTSLRSLVAAVAAAVSFTHASFAELPEGYWEVPYVQSDGTAYVDTGYMPNGSTKLEMIADLCVTMGGDHYIFGADSRANKSSAGITFDANGTALEIHSPGTGYVSLGLLFSSTEWQSFSFVYEGGVSKVENLTTGVVKENDKSSQWTSGGFADYQFANTIYLFTRHGSSSSLSAVATCNSETRITSFKVWENGVLVRNLVPAMRASDCALGFYDLADHSGEPEYEPFHANACATGSLVTGLKPDDLVGKHRLAYLESDGAQDINTGIVFKDTPRVETCFWSKDTGDVDYMGMPTQKNDCFIIDYNTTALYYCYCAYGYATINYSSPKVQEGWSEWIYGPDVYFNGEKLWSASSWDFSANEQEFHVFRGRTFGKLQLKYVRMYDGDELVFDGFPALVDGVPGLWDKVTSTLFENGGSRPLLYGPVVPTQAGDFTCFKVSGRPLELGSVSPAYGEVAAATDDEIECSAPASVEQDGVKATLLGWELSYDGGEPETGDASPVTVTVGAGATDLVWKWQTQCLLTVEQGANGTVAGTDGWKDFGDVVELTATPDDGYGFTGWNGDVPAENWHDNPLRLTMDRARRVSARFDKASARHVNPTDPNAADDTSHGSAALPWKTLAYAVAQANEGGEIILAKGVHPLTAAINVEKKLTICGAGENWETVLDGQNKMYKLTVSAAGALVHSLTFYRVGGEYDEWLALVLSGDSTVSNVVVRGVGNEFPENRNGRNPVRLSAGLMTHCWITNNCCYGNCGVTVNGPATLSDCYIAGNKSRASTYHYGVVHVSHNNAMVRNCTIVDNEVEACAGLYVAVAPNAKICNNLVWGNVNYTDNKTANVGQERGWENWYGNCADPLPGAAEKGNIADDPKLLGDRKHFSSDSPCRGTAVAEYATAFDLDGNPRGATPSIGAFEYVKSDEMLVSINCAAVGRLPDGIPLFGVVDGTYTEPLAYAWSFKGDGTVDSVEANPVIRETGYFQPTLVVTDAAGKKAAAAVAAPIYIHAAGVTTFYVDYENGSDENDGLAKATAWQTIPYAIGADVVFANDEIVLVEGSHPLANGANLEKPIVLRGEGDKEKSVIDGQGNENELSVKANGATVCNLTLANFRGQYGLVLAMSLSGNSVVSNVVFRDNGVPKNGNSREVINMSAGLLTHCWVTNNTCAGNAGVVLSGSGIVENCAFLDNLSAIGTGADPSVVQLGGGTFRNNTVANNRTKVDDTRRTQAVHVSRNAKPKVYNNIIWNNVDADDATIDRNWSVGEGGSTENWRNNCTTRIADLTGEGNIGEDPLFEDGAVPEIRPVSPCRNKGDKTLGATSATDLLGNPRVKSKSIDIGCVECQQGQGFLLLVR